MPRGIPNAKKDETGLRFTSFHVPLGYVFPRCLRRFELIKSGSWYLDVLRRSHLWGVFSFGAPVDRLNPKNTGSTYIKSDANTLWARNAARRAKEPAPVTEV
jgi:actin-related protein 8